MAPTTGPAPNQESAYALFVRARSAITSVVYPRRLNYTISVRGTEASRLRTNHYTASCDPSTGSIRVLPISAEELASPPPRPHDFNFSKLVISGPTGPILIVPIGPPPDPDLLGGVPILEPTYTFGLTYRWNAPSKNDGETTTSLPVIAIVSSNVRDYDVTLVDTPMLAGIPTYHLRLVPRHKPKDFRLRELWISTNDFLPRQALISGNFTVAPLVDVPWLITFSVADGVPYIARESAEATLYLAHRHVVSDATIAFDNIQEPSSSIVGQPLIAPDIEAESLIEP